jgi:hypothetical protein
VLSSSLILVGEGVHKLLEKKLSAAVHNSRGVGGKAVALCEEEYRLAMDGNFCEERQINWLISKHYLPFFKALIRV